MTELPQRGPKRELSTERIVEAAIDIADADGLDAVSMGRVATALGFTPMSLYRYVTSKDDLLLLMFDAASEVPLPPVEGSWRDQLRSWAGFVRAAYLAHPWLADMPPSSTPTTPHRLALMDAAVGAMRDVRVPDESKVAITLLLLGYIGLFGAAARDDAVDDAVRRALPQLVTPERFPHLAPVVQAGVFDAPVSESDQAFHFGLGRILDGFEAWAERGEPDPPGEDVPVAVVRDKHVREAAKAVRDAEAKLAVAQRKAQHVTQRAIDRERAAEQKAAAKAEAKAEAKRQRRS